MAIIYDTENLELKTKGCQSLLRACIKNKVPISHSCDGMGSCGTCRVIVTEGLENLPPRNSLEKEMAEDRGFYPHERLACQIETDTSFSFKLPED